MKAINCLIVLLLLVLSAIISVVISKSSKNFCEEYVKNGQKIDYAFRLFEDNKYKNTDSDKYFIIGDNCWQLTYSDGSDKTVTIDSLNSTDKFDRLSGKNYSMVWTTITRSSKLSNTMNVTGALRKNSNLIDWRLYNFAYLYTTTIDFQPNFKPALVWSPMPITENYPIITFWDNNNNNDIKTQTFNFSFYLQPTDNIYETTDQQKFVINGKQEIKINKVTKLMAIVRQYSQYDYANGKDDKIGGQGSIVFMNIPDNSVIKYCYVGNPFNETACKPNNLKTLIKCSSKTTITATPTTTGTQTNGPINWFKWLKTTFLIVVNEN
ncbi:uncharacterized protein LOC128962771 [Oppia nitens]|uniref:uncharacterized protein LOC128962771 n=1 Tax=Oppia nitens TaxID=1686743 RepID=UPI0023DB6EAD|nr:uncharacterized protein LOC128962771 [Oppia nitens]